MRWLADLLQDPKIRGVNLDTGERLRAHGDILSQKPLLRRVFREFHLLLDDLDKRYFRGAGLRIELGAGVMPMRETFPDVLATDIVPRPGLDCVLDAEALALASCSVRAIFGINCFHHFHHPARFLSEVERVVVDGGGAILIEPYFGILASLVFPYLFRTERFDKKASTWDTPGGGPMSEANQALSYIIFERDRPIFQRMFPRLEVVHREVCRNYLLYLFSGGLNFRQLIPDWGIPLLSRIQGSLKPLDPFLALHHVIVIRKMA